MGKKQDLNSLGNERVEEAAWQPLLSESFGPSTMVLNVKIASLSWAMVFLIVLLLCNFFLLFINYNLWLMYGGSHGSFSTSPAYGVAATITRNEHATDHTKYSAFSGPPNEDNIKAWEDLIQPTFFSATELELKQAGEDPERSIRLAEGGYVAAIGVYHEIHCLRQMRLFLYSKVFYPNLTEANIKWVQGHLDHCLETIRISLMCSADLSLYTFEWSLDDPDRAIPKSDASRRCIDWDQLESWAKKRQVSLDPFILKSQPTENHD